MDFSFLRTVGRVLAHTLRVTAIASIVILGIPALYDAAAVQLRLDANIYDFMNTFFLVYIIFFLHSRKKEKSNRCYFEMDCHQDLDGVPGFDEEKSE